MSGHLLRYTNSSGPPQTGHCTALTLTPVSHNGVCGQRTVSLCRHWRVPGATRSLPGWKLHQHLRELPVWMPARLLPERGNPNLWRWDSGAALHGGIKRSAPGRGPASPLPTWLVKLPLGFFLLIGVAVADDRLIYGYLLQFIVFLSERGLIRHKWAKWSSVQTGNVSSSKTDDNYIVCRKSR